MGAQTPEYGDTTATDFGQIKSPAARATTAELLISLRKNLEERIPDLVEDCQDQLDELEDALEDEEGEG